MNEFNPSFSRKMKQTISSTFLSISSIQNGNDYPFGISLLYPWVFPLSGHPIHWPFFKNRFAELEIAFSHCDPIFKRKNRTLKGRKNSGHSRTGFRHLEKCEKLQFKKGSVRTLRAILGLTQGGRNDVRRYCYPFLQCPFFRTWFSGFAGRIGFFGYFWDRAEFDGQSDRRFRGWYIVVSAGVQTLPRVEIPWKIVISYSFSFVQDQQQKFSRNRTVSSGFIRYQNGWMNARVCVCLSTFFPKTAE